MQHAPAIRKFVATTFRPTIVKYLNQQRAQQQQQAIEITSWPLVCRPSLEQNFGRSCAFQLQNLVIFPSAIAVFGSFVLFMK